MGNEWVQLKNIVRIKGGKRLPKGVFLQQDKNKHPYIRVRDMGSRYIPKEGLEYVPEKIFQKIKNYIVEENDVIISIVGTVGLVSVIDEYFHLASQTENCAKLSGLNKYDAIYLYYCLISSVGQQAIAEQTVGAVQPKLPLYGIESIPIPWPVQSKRYKIAHILGSLDDKIELNRQMNTTLEAMAQALFKSWFVDFDPVMDNALAAGNPIPDELEAKAAARQALGDARKPLPEDIRSLFPNAFVFTEEMGWIPEGWKVLSVSEAITVNPSVQLKKGEVAPFIDMKALPTSGYAIDDVSRKAYAGGAKFKNKDVLLARITPCLENGKTGVVDFLKNGESGFGSTEFIILRGRNGLNMPFVACLARDDKFRTHCIQSMVGSSGRQRVQNACFDSFYLCLPKSEKIKEQFHDSTNGFFEKITTLKNETNSLTQLRDTLLPKLLSGELRIPEAERLVEEVIA